MPQPNLITTDEALQRTGLKRSTYWDYRRSGKFPQPVRLGLRSVMFREKDIAEWIKQRRRIVCRPANY